MDYLPRFCSIIALLIVPVGVAVFLLVRSFVRKLKQSEDRFRSVLENALDAAYRWNARLGIYDYISPVIERITGFSADEITGTNMEWVAQNIHPDDLDAVRCEVVAVTMGKKPLGIAQYRVQAKNGSFRWVADRFTMVFDGSGSPLYRVGVVRDINEEKESEKRLLDSLAEKETLIRELYHRTKNNMQLISGILNLQARESDDVKVKSVLRETGNRIMSMALVHRQLYEARNLSRISFAEYVRNLVGNASGSYGSPDSLVLTKLSLEEFPVSIDIAIPCGLVLNELLSNSYKHAFPPDFNGTGIITLVLSRNDGCIRICYADNGTGVPAGFDCRDARTLGCKLIRNIIEYQLEGSAIPVNGEGLRWDISFPDRARRDRI